jgi:hypothetical protein
VPAGGYQRHHHVEGGHALAISGSFSLRRKRSMCRRGLRTLRIAQHQRVAQHFFQRNSLKASTDGELAPPPSVHPRGKCDDSITYVVGLCKADVIQVVVQSFDLLG